MRISGLSIKSLRNHIETDLELSDGLNVFYGLNGSGKTSILEGVSICGFSKSFLPCSDSSLVRNGDEFYFVSANSKNDLDIDYRIAVRYANGQKKQIKSTLGDNLLPKDVIGEIPMIILSPDYKAITFGAPEDRRQFIDRVLSQASRIYLDDLMKYRHTLKQRNSLLFRAKADRSVDYSELEPWTDLLVRTGVDIILRRRKFIEEFTPKFNETYRDVVEGREVVDIKYVSNGFDDISEFAKISKDDLIGYYLNIFARNRDSEIQRGTTIFGPQKDDIQILINNGIARDYASQGQHKSLLISLKFTEFYILKDKKNETPVILLDDIFSELDEERTKKVFDIIEANSAQTFITLTDAQQIKKVIGSKIHWSFFKLNNGIAVKEIN